MSWRGRVLIASALATRVALGDQEPIEAVVAVASPSSIGGPFLGVFASFSAAPPSPEELTAWSPPGDELGCQRYSPPARATGHPLAVVVRRGNCSFLEKAKLARDAGARSLVVVSDTDRLEVMGAGSAAAGDVGIFVVGVQKSAGDRILSWFGGHPGDPVVLSLKTYQVSIFDLSEVLLIAFATALVALGAFFATADLREGSPFAPQGEEEVKEIDARMAVSFFMCGSVALVVLYFLMRYLIYLIIFGFCLGSVATWVDFGSSSLAYLFPALGRRRLNLRIISFSVVELLALVPGTGLAVAWFCLRNAPQGWIFQDIIGCGFLCFVQRLFRMPNIRVATLLLVIMFAFDIFWVFLSPLIFSKSVMVAVATGGGSGEAVPMVFRFPTIGDPFGHERILGFGDIVIPGLLVSFLRRYDILSKRGLCGGYFLPSVVGYAVGLLATVMALMLMRTGQPALLWLVPATLGTTLLLAARRGEVRCLWEGVPAGGARSPGISQGLAAGTDLQDFTPATNDEGFQVRLGTRPGFQDKFYCGRLLGKTAIPGSDGQCGPADGPQCRSCARFQDSQQAAGVGQA